MKRLWRPVIRGNVNSPLCKVPARVMQNKRATLSTFPPTRSFDSHNIADRFARHRAIRRSEHVRTIFIQTEHTPNDDARKFLPNCQILPEALHIPYLEYMNLRSTVAPPYPSPLASQLMNVDGVKSIFYGPDFITVTKASDADWAHLSPEIFSLITETVNSGEGIVKSLSTTSADEKPMDDAGDSLESHENDSEVVGMIKELLETRIRPAIQDDGGDIEYRGFEDGKVLLKLRGACRTCDSSTVTLKNGIENMLMHYIEEVKGIEQVLDEEEEIAIQEFAKFEEKLKQQKSPA